MFVNGKLIRNINVVKSAVILVFWLSLGKAPKSLLTLKHIPASPHNSVLQGAFGRLCSLQWCSFLIDNKQQVEKSTTVTIYSDNNIWNKEYQTEHFRWDMSFLNWRKNELCYLWMYSVFLIMSLPRSKTPFIFTWVTISCWCYHVHK